MQLCDLLYSGSRYRQGPPEVKGASHWFLCAPLMGPKIDGGAFYLTKLSSN